MLPGQAEQPANGHRACRYSPRPLTRRGNTARRRVDFAGLWRPLARRSAVLPESNMSALICGSLAYDTIMVFQDQFKNHILPAKVHILNVSFLVPNMRREFGGCAGNIAYNLKLLGDDPLPMATVGQDFAPYRAHLVNC